MTRPILTWALLWLFLTSAFTVAIVVGALLLSAIDVRASSSTGPDAALLPRRAHVADDAGGVSVHPSPPATMPQVSPGIAWSAGPLSGLSGAPSLRIPSPATFRPASPREAGHAASAPSAAMPVQSATGMTAQAVKQDGAWGSGESLSNIQFGGARSAPGPSEISGVASWWASFGPGIYAALPGYVAGTRVRIRVCVGSRCVDAPVITSCDCFVGTPDERIVDLSPGMLRALGLDKARGLYQVTVEVLR